MIEEDYTINALRDKIKKLEKENKQMAGELKNWYSTQCQNCLHCIENDHGKVNCNTFDMWTNEKWYCADFERND